MKFYSLFKLEYVSWKFNSCSVRLHLTKYLSWNNRDKTKRTQIHFWSDIFAAVMSSDRKVPFDGAAHGSFRKTWNDNWRFITSTGLSAGTGKLCIFGHLGLVFIWSCFVSCLLLLLYYVICAPVLTEGTTSTKTQYSFTDFAGELW